MTAIASCSHGMHRAMRDSLVQWHRAMVPYSRREGRGRVHPHLLIDELYWFPRRDVEAIARFGSPSFFITLTT